MLHPPKSTIIDNQTIVFNMYSHYISEYMNQINKKIHTFNSNKQTFIIMRGIDAITHIFLYLYYYTQNTDVLQNYLEKTVLSYIEFIDQINASEFNTSNLTSRDAMQFLYEKTIYDIQQKHKHNGNKSNDMVNYVIRATCNKIKNNVCNLIHESKDTFMTNTYQFMNELYHSNSILTTQLIIC